MGSFRQNLCRFSGSNVARCTVSSYFLLPVKDRAPPHIRRTLPQETYVAFYL